MKIIRISTELEMTVYNYPTGTISQQNRALRELIGNGCDIFEHVRPRRLYTELHMESDLTKEPGQCVSMLIDEGGCFKENKPNLVGSYLYETDRHGHPIMGNILFIGEERRGGEPGFCGINDSVFKLLESQLRLMILLMNETRKVVLKNLRD